MMGAMQYGRSGGMEVSRAVNGNDSSVIGGGLMAQHKRGGPDLTHDSEYVSGCSATSALVWSTAQHRGQPYRSTLGGKIDGRACVLPKYLKILFITLLYCDLNVIKECQNLNNLLISELKDDVCFHTAIIYISLVVNCGRMQKRLHKIKNSRICSK